MDAAMSPFDPSRTCAVSRHAVLFGTSLLSPIFSRVRRSSKSYAKCLYRRELCAPGDRKAHHGSREAFRGRLAGQTTPTEIRVEQPQLSLYLDVDGRRSSFASIGYRFVDDDICASEAWFRAIHDLLAHDLPTDAPSSGAKSRIFRDPV